jgi:3D (Asp-Asp-Asp) domain-containing protein
LRMIVIRHGLLGLIGVLGFGLVAPSAALAREDLSPGASGVVVGTEGRGLRLRNGPGVTHRVLAVLPDGAPVQVIGGPVSDGTDEWYQLRTDDGKSGWSIERHLRPATTSLTTPAPPPAPAATTQAAQPPLLSALSLPPGGEGGRTFLAKTTAYANGVGGVPRNARTASGTRTRWGVIAVDPKVVPLGSMLKIDGYDIVFTAEDTGRAIKGHTIDIWLPDSKEARAYGIKYRTVTVLREGSAR